MKVMASCIGDSEQPGKSGERQGCLFFHVSVKYVKYVKCLISSEHCKIKYKIKTYIIIFWLIIISIVYWCVKYLQNSKINKLHNNWNNNYVQIVGA